MYFAPVACLTARCSVVIPMRVADQQHPGVTELESELLDARAKQRHVRFEVAVDEDVAGSVTMR